MVVFKKRDSVRSARYSSVCNVLRQWRIWLIPSYSVYRLYDIILCFAQVKSMDDNCGEWVECMGVASGCGE